MRTAALVVVMLAFAAPAGAVSSPAELMADPAQESRAEAIGKQLRCMVCQNESVEESEADLARDFRRIIRTRVAAGESDAAIIGWMTARYGDFIRLRPPFNALTAALWGAPALALLIGGGAAFLGRRRRAALPPSLSDEERQRLAELLRS